MDRPDTPANAIRDFVSTLESTDAAHVGDLRIAASLRDFRETFELDRNAVCTACNLSKSYWSRLESGKRRMSDLALVKVMLGTYQLIRATRKRRQFEYYTWLFDQFLPAVYAFELERDRQRQEYREANRQKKLARLAAEQG